MNNETEFKEFRLKPEYGQNHIKAIVTADRGDRIWFGRWPDVDTIEPILWRVLAKQDNKLLLISVHNVYNLQYHRKAGIVTWKDCSLRAWLNGPFLNEAFSREERARMISTPLAAENGADIDPSDDDAAQDTVFLLSISEAERYFASNRQRTCYRTRTNVDRWLEDREILWYMSGVGDPEGSCATDWWLRSPGNDSGCAAFVWGPYCSLSVYVPDEASKNGEIDICGRPVNSYVGVRPSIWLQISDRA